MIAWRRWVGSVVLVLHVALFGGSVAAQSLADGADIERTPTFTVNKASVSPGEEVVVTLTDWPGRSVTVSVCGNQALRGSQDCNMVESETESLSRDGSPSLAALPVGIPPIHCPCVLRGSSRTNDIVLFAPIEIVGHPVGPLIEPEGFEPLDISVDVHKANMGLVTRLRSALGGPTPYDVTVIVQNRTGAVVPGLAVTGALGRGKASDNAAVEFPPIGDLGAGQTWRETARVTVPAPAVGSFVVTATASGAGPSVDAADTLKRVPLLMLVLIALLVGDLTAILMRRRAKRRVANAGEDDVSGADDTMVGSLGFVP